MRRTLTRIIDLVVDAMTWGAGGVCLLMALHVTADLVGRGLFNHPLLGTDEIATNYYMVALSFLPLAMITRLRGHITVGLFTDRLPAKARQAIDLFADLTSFGFVGIVAWMGVETAFQKTAAGEMTESSTGYLPTWEARWILAAGFVMMFAYLAINVLKDIRALSGTDRKWIGQ